MWGLSVPCPTLWVALDGVCLLVTCLPSLRWGWGRIPDLFLASRTSGRLPFSSISEPGWKASQGFVAAKRYAGAAQWQKSICRLMVVLWSLGVMFRQLHFGWLGPKGDVWWISNHWTRGLHSLKWMTTWLCTRLGASDRFQMHVSTLMMLSVDARAQR